MKSFNHTAERALAKDARERAQVHMMLDNGRASLLADAIDRLCDEAEAEVTRQYFDAEDLLARIAALRWALEGENTVMAAKALAADDKAQND
jgi:hypothetical protein